MITDEKLKFWIDNKLNVLFVGEHGVGKTARVKKAFDDSNLKWLYFSAATLDPWVDFIGIPKEVEGSDGQRYIELIRPKAFADDEVEAIFLDEFNRSPKKVRNAVMELLQFKSINGKRFNNLKIVWAAVNPDNKSSDGSGEFEYDVEKLDPAQRDRFEIQVEVPYKPDRTYFQQKFGTELSDDAIDWWNGLDEVAKKAVSPRRLDYALGVYLKGGDIRDVLPVTVNVTKLLQELRNGSYIKQLCCIFAKKDDDAAKEFLSVRNNYDNTIAKITKSQDYMNFFMPYVKEEDLVSLMVEDPTVYQFVIDNINSYAGTINNIVDVNSGSKLAKKLKKEPAFDAIRQSLKKSVVAKQIGEFRFSSNVLLQKPIVKNQYKDAFSSLNGLSYASYITNQSVLSSTMRRGTQYKVGIFHKLLQNYPTDISKENKIIVLQTLTDIIIRSNKEALKQTTYDGLPEFFGHVANSILVTSGFDDVNVNALMQTVKNRCSNDEERNRLTDFFFRNGKLYV